MITAGSISLSQEQCALITPEQAWYYKIIPKCLENGVLHLYVDHSHFDDLVNDELEILFGQKIVAEKTDPAEIIRSLNKYYRKSNATSKVVNVQTSQADDFLAKLIVDARQLGSSDIHIEIYDEKARVRIRIDGMLVERYQLSKNEYPALVNKIKIRSGLDIAEKRLPQDGRIKFHEHDLKIDIRVSVLPTLHGEKIVLRLLNNDAGNIDISKLGFSEQELAYYLEGIKKPHGILLISGPTGSGKTTTLYATLKILNEEKRNIVTVEDPIEYTLDGINQVQLKENIGLTFASALRTFLRQDPDIIMLGEIRDGETAQMAIRAALTGHLVLSTIHTNSAWGTISRLSDMGVPPFLIASTLNTSVAQRLLRLLCNNCKKEEEIDRKLFPSAFNIPGDLKTHYTPVGCDECHYTGYRGRKAIYEIIPVDYEITERIKTGASQIDDLLKTRNIKTLAENALELYRNGVTSLDEIYSLLMNIR